jgi:superfamily II DNA or RNA helicase
MHRRHFEAVHTTENPLYIENKRRNKSTWGIDKNIETYHYSNDVLKLPKTALDYVLTHLKKENIEYSLSEDLPCRQLLDFEWNTDIDLRDYQDNAFVDIYEKSGVVIAPAGSGKTVLGLYYAYSLNMPTLWLTHTLDLATQCEERLNKFFKSKIRVGRIGNNQQEFGDRKFIICTFQTLQARPALLKELNEFINVVIVDEVHHAPSPFFSEVIYNLKYHYILGLTATKERKDRQDFLLTDIVGPILHTIDRQELYKDNQLIKPDIIFVPTKFQYNTSYKETEQGAILTGDDNLNWHDFVRTLIRDVQRQELIIDNIVKEIQPGNYQMVLSESIEYAFTLKKRLLKVLAEKGYKGVVVELIHGGLIRTEWHQVKDEAEAKRMFADYLCVNYRQNEKSKFWEVQIENYTQEEYAELNVTKAQREVILKRVANRHVHILFATRLAKEGLDIPHLNIGHTVSPKKGDQYKRADGSGTEQEIGRIMRTDPLNPKKVARWYDYVDSLVDMCKHQYYSRRKVYKRLDLKMPAQIKSKTEVSDDLFSNFNKFFY